MEKFYYEDIDEHVYVSHLPNGLTVALFPKKEYQKIYASLSVNFGSFDHEFIPYGKNKYFTAPYGIAHFLEHKMFDMDKEDASIHLSALGASSNAFTSYNRTTYLFTATSNKIESTLYLLDFVQTPFFHKKQIEKEKGIIIEEIKMYLDDPEFIIQQHLFSNLYFNHPINKDIMGTIDSVKSINEDDLNICYETFYQPRNMILAISGCFDVYEMEKAIYDNQMSKSFKPYHKIERKIIEEPFMVKKDYEIIFDENTTIPKLMMGFKLKNTLRDPNSQMLFEIGISIYLDILFGESSDNYQKLLNLELINESFEFVSNHENGIDYLILEAESKDPILLKNHLEKMINESQKKNIEEDFIRVRNALYGSFVRSLNSLEAIANFYTRYSFMSMNFFEVIDAIKNIQLSDVNKFFLKDTVYSTIIVFPIEK